MPKPPARIPSQSRPPDRLPTNDGEPKLNKRQADEFFAADHAANKILDELEAMDKLPDGGDQARRDELIAALKVQTDVVMRYTALTSEMYKHATEEDLAKMNRADRRRLEARLRKKRRPAPKG